MLPDANLLFYTNLSGEVFYIIAHRMKSQAVKLDLQQRVYNDLAICICHPVVVQNLIHGKLQILEMSMTDIRTLMDRIVHSSIMTVNSYSMEKLFELTLIATRYQYTVCQHPSDILLIALNHLDGIRNSITDPTGIKMCESLHKTFVERLRGESSMKMQEYRFEILTYLVDVKLKMTNLIKLGFQKTSGEFVKDFPEKFSRAEFKQPGTIELFAVDHLERSDSSDTSDSNNEVTEDSFNIDEEVYDELPCELQWMSNNEFGGEYHYGEEDGCHFENISLQIHDHELQEDDELLEIEYVENSFQEILESVKTEPSAFVVKFSRRKSQDDSYDREKEGSSVPLISSYELHGTRGVTLGQSIYEIPGNSDEDDDKSVPASNNTAHSYNPGESTKPNSSSNLQETDLNSVAIKAVHGLELCSMLLGCKNDSEAPYKSPLSNFRSYSSVTDGERLHSPEPSSSPAPYNIPFESCSSSQSSSIRAINNKSNPLTGINIVKFDARTDRSQSKAALSKISKEMNFGSEDINFETSKETIRHNVFDVFEPND